MYTYHQTEPRLWTVGTGEFSTPSWAPDSDHDSWAEARDAATRLNGGVPASDVTALREQLPALDGQCADCGGDGKVDNPAFADLESRYDAGQKACLAAGNGLSAWRASAKCRDLDEESYRIPERTDCKVCSGTGATLTEAGRILLGFLDRHRNLAGIQREVDSILKTSYS